MLLWEQLNERKKSSQSFQNLSKRSIKGNYQPSKNMTEPSKSDKHYYIQICVPSECIIHERSSEGYFQCLLAHLFNLHMYTLDRTHCTVSMGEEHLLQYLLLFHV